MTPRYPHIHVQLTNEDGNAVGIIMKVQRTLRQASVPADEIEQFKKDATAGDYDNLLIVVQKTVTVS